MSDQNGSSKRVIRVPKPTVIEPGSGEYRDIEDDDVLVSPADIGSASRSCLAIIIILLVIVLLICLFLLAQPFVD